MIRFFLLFSALATSALAAPACLTKADAMSPGIHVESRNWGASQFTVASDGKVTENIIEGDSWRYESLGSIFLLRYGPFKDGVFDPEKMDTARYMVPLTDLPAIEKGMKWQGDVSYTSASKPPWKAKMTVTAKSAPNLELGNCSYEAVMVLVAETHKDETSTTFFMFLPEFGFGIQTGFLSGMDMETYTPLSIRRVGDD